MKIPLISVIVPCYNVEKYVSECLESIVNQSYQNLEIIIVNDGATDNTEQKILPFLEDERVKYIVQKNQGLSGARNTGLDNMNGEFVCFMDSDDYIHQDFVKNLYQNLVENDADISICDFLEFRDGKILDFCEIENNEISTFSRDEIMQEMLRNWRICIAWNKLYKSELFDDLRFALGKIHEDEFLAHHILYKAKKVVKTNKQFYFYRQVEGSIINSNYTENKFINAIEAFDDRILFFKKHSIPNIEIVYIQKWYNIIIKKAILKYNLYSAKKYLLSHPVEYFIKFKASKKEKIKFYFQMLKEII